jgi:hypothetical protein
VAEGLAQKNMKRFASLLENFFINLNLPHRDRRLMGFWNPFQ